jgi:hypothetical protein
LLPYEIQRVDGTCPSKLWKCVVYIYERVRPRAARDGRPRLGPHVTKNGREEGRARMGPAVPRRKSSWDHILPHLTQTRPRVCKVTVRSTHLHQKTCYIHKRNCPRASLDGETLPVGSKRGPTVGKQRNRNSADGIANAERLTQDCKQRNALSHIPPHPPEFLLLFHFPQPRVIYRKIPPVPNHQQK